VVSRPSVPGALSSCTSRFTENAAVGVAMS
jgi:hypothetical protein